MEGRLTISQLQRDKTSSIWKLFLAKTPYAVVHWLSATTAFPAETTRLYARALLTLEKIRSDDSLLLHDEARLTRFLVFPRILKGSTPRKA